jgi:hypothetical protein
VIMNSHRKVIRLEKGRLAEEVTDVES